MLSTCYLHAIYMLSTCYLHAIYMLSTDINECLLRTDDCSDLATCRNTLGGYECHCLPGFYGDGFICNGYTSARELRYYRNVSIMIVYM